MSAQRTEWQSAPPPAIADLENTVRNLEAALQTARIIGQAQGVLMVERRCTAPEAFDELVQMSQHLNIKLHQVAADLVDGATRAQSHCAPPNMAVVNGQHRTGSPHPRAGVSA